MVGSEIDALGERITMYPYVRVEDYTALHGIPNKLLLLLISGNGRIRPGR